MILQVIMRHSLRFSLLVDDCFVFLVLKGHLDMVIVELDELELV